MRRAVAGCAEGVDAGGDEACVDEKCGEPNKSDGEVEEEVDLKKEKLEAT